MLLEQQVCQHAHFFLTLAETALPEADGKALIGECLVGLAGVTRLQGQPARAVRMLAAAGLYEAMGKVMERADHADYERIVAALHNQLDEEAWQAAWAEGRAMTLEQGMAYALEETPDA